MSPTLLKALMIGIPVLVGLIGVILVIVLIREGIKGARNAKNSVSGILFIHAEHGGGHELRFNDKTLVKPELRPIWYKEHWYSSEFPLWFFYEDKVETRAPATEHTFKCTCGQEFPGRPQLHGHTLWNPKRKVDGQPVTKEAWAALHSKVEVAAVNVPVRTDFVIKPYDIDAETADVALTPFSVFDINNWECQNRFLAKRQTGLVKTIQLGAGVVMVCACLIGIIAIAGELNKPNTGATQVNKPATMVLEQKTW